MTITTRVPGELSWRGIPLPREAHGFSISLDTAEPWGGGTIGGRVEAHGDERPRGEIAVSLRCLAAWLDAAPQLLGKKSFFRIDTYWELRTRSPVWLDDEVWSECTPIGDLLTANWLPFGIRLPDELPRAFEGTFVAFRYELEARRARRLGREVASVPILLVERRTIPTVRVETNSIGSWRLLELRSEEERDGAAGRCSVRYEPRDARSDAT